VPANHYDQQAQNVLVKFDFAKVRFSSVLAKYLILENI